MNLNIPSFYDLPFILTEGGVVEIIRRNYPHQLDPYLANARMIYNEEGREILSTIYTNYIESANRHGLPILLFAPTWRCQTERIAFSDYEGDIGINLDVVEFVINLVKPYRDQGSAYLGALVGCKGDPYKPQDGLTEAASIEYHQSQIIQLGALDIDVIEAATLPYLPEALGIAQLLASTQLPYIVSFMISPQGCLLDGTSISEAIVAIDNKVNRKPAFYMSNCIHPDHFITAYRNKRNDPDILESRFKGFQANTSRLSPEDLNDSINLDFAETPQQFARKLLSVKTECSLKLIGGCCGTDARHIEHIASGLSL